MPTTKQKIASSKVVENRGNVSKAMRDAGYSPSSAKNPKNLTESKGYQELMDEHGLTDELLLDALVSDIIAKPKNRTKELELGLKLRGKLKDASPITINSIALILGKYGIVFDAGQAEDSTQRLPEDSTRS